MPIVIVAIPKEEDDVWKYSSEKVPHMTLLYLGDGPLTDEENVIQYVQHVASTSLREFGMTKDRRGPLGPDRADVLFFEKGWRNKDLLTIRSYLLKNEAIAQAYLSSKQFPEWTPHLTMGYPTAPAKTLENPWDCSYVQFDRIAIWFGDSEGPEFQLRKQFDEIDYVEPSMYQSAPENEESLAHYGKKGMKWGVRKDVLGIATLNTGEGGTMVAPGGTAGPSRSDQKTLQKTMTEVRKHLLRGKDSPFRPDGEVDQLSAKYRAAGKTASKHAVDYDRDVAKILTNYVNTKLPDGAVSLVAFSGNDALIAIGNRQVIAQWENDISHADELPYVLRMPLVRDDDGFIVGIEEIVKQSEIDALADDILVHYGRLGMRWGVRRDEKALSTADKALNLHQRSQVKIASGVSALAAIGITSNVAATAFKLQNRFEHLKTLQAGLDAAEANPFLGDAAREGLRATKSKMVKALVGSALATTAITAAIGIVTQRTAKAYFAPLHKVYADSKPKINADLRRLSKDIKSGKRSSLNAKDYHAEVSKIVEKHMTTNKNNLLSPFHELARNQLGLEYNTKKLDITFSKLPNTNLAEKVTIVTPDGLKLVKAIKTVEHAASDDSIPDIDYFFDYKFDSEGYIDEWSCPTIEIAHDLIEGTFDLAALESQYPEVTEVKQTALDDVIETALAHSGVKGMKWGVRKDIAAVASLRTGDGALLVRDNVKNPSRLDKKQTAKAMGELRGDFLASPDSPFAPNGAIPKLRAKYEATGKPTPAKVAAFDKEAAVILTDYAKSRVPEGATALVHINSGSATIVIGSPEIIAAYKKEILHTDDLPFVYSMPLVRDDSGYIIGIEDGGEIKHFDDADDFIAHYGRLGMKWGVRRPTGPDGRVRSPVTAKIVKKGPKSDDPLEGVIKKARKGKNTSEDHKKLVKDLSKTVEKLSTADIKAINARLQAVEKLKQNQANAKLANQSFPSKLAKFALNSVTAAVKEKGDSYIKALTKDLLDDVLPDSPFGKAKKAKAAKDADEAADKARKETDDDVQNHPNFKTKPGPTSADFGDPSPPALGQITPERQLALETLADQIARQNG